MTKNQLWLRNSILSLFIIAAAIYRVFSFSTLATWANFTPVGAMAIFAGTYFKPTWKAIIIPLGILFLSDMLLNKMLIGSYNPFYDGFWITYLIFIVITISGAFIRNINFISILLVSLFAVLIHWIISDIQPWLSSAPADGIYYYTKDLAGFWKCLLMAIPFEVKFLQSTLLFNFVLFGAFELLKSKLKILQLQTETKINLL